MTLQIALTNIKMVIGGVKYFRVANLCCRKIGIAINNDKMYNL